MVGDETRPEDDREANELANRLVEIDPQVRRSDYLVEGRWDWSGMTDDWRILSSQGAVGPATGSAGSPATGSAGSTAAGDV
eukprot:6487357-Amphidinium_carterae.1